jgi:hypothetical protein
MTVPLGSLLLPRFHPSPDGMYPCMHVSSVHNTFFCQ